MEISAQNSSVYSKYQNLLDRYKGGEMSYQEAVQEHLNLKPELAGKIGLDIKANIPMPIDTSRVFVSDIRTVIANQSVEDENDGPNASHLSEYLSVTQAYNTMNAQSSTDHLDITKGNYQGGSPRLDTKYMGIVSPTQMAQMRHNFNMAASDTLTSYASNNPSEWKAAAQELGIDISGWKYGDHFTHQPDDSGIDVSVGVANSDAEKIFRHIASADEIATFNNEMAPIQHQMHMRVDQGVETVKTDLLAKIEMNNSKLHDFAQQIETLSSAGVNIEDLNIAQISRTKSGDYAATNPSNIAHKIEGIINNNPKIRAIYNARWSEINPHNFKVR